MGMSNKLESGVFLRKFIKILLLSPVAILLITSLSEFLKSVRMTKADSVESKLSVVNVTKCDVLSLNPTNALLSFNFPAFELPSIAHNVSVILI